MKMKRSQNAFKERSNPEMSEIKVSQNSLKNRQAALRINHLPENLRKLEEFNYNTFSNVCDEVIGRYGQLKQSIQYSKGFAQERGKEHDISKLENAIDIQIEGIKHMRMVIREHYKTEGLDAFKQLASHDANKMFLNENHPEKAKTTVGGLAINIPTPYYSMQRLTRHTPHNAIKHVAGHFVKSFNTIDAKLCKLAPAFKRVQTPPNTGEHRLNLQGVRVERYDQVNDLAHKSFDKQKQAIKGGPLMNEAINVLWNERDARSAEVKKIDLDLAYSAQQQQRIKR